MSTDSIADMLTRVRNASRAKQKKVDLPASKLKIAIAELWKKQGFIRNFRLYREDTHGILRLYLRYGDKGQPVILGLKRVSRPGRRVYLSNKRLPIVLGGLGVSIVSTSKGLMSDQAARESRLGGELLCTIW